MRAKAEGPRTLGVDPATGHERLRDERPLRRLRAARRDARSAAPKGEGRVKGAKAEKVEKPKRASLQAGMTESTITLDEALKLLSLPRVVGLHPDDNEPITTNFGRFGPYVKHGDEFRSLESEDDVFNISFDAALALIRAPKQSRRRQSAQKKVLHELTQGDDEAARARRPLRPVRDRRHDQRVDSEGVESRGADLRAGDGAARGAPQRRAVAPPRRRAARRRERPRAAPGRGARSRRRSPSLKAQPDRAQRSSFR